MSGKLSKSTSNPTRQGSTDRPKLVRSQDWKFSLVFVRSKVRFFFRALVRSSPKFSICFGPVPVRGQSVLVHESLIPGTNVNVGKCAQGICLPPTRFCWIDIVARGLNGIHSVTFSLFSHFSSLQITKKEKKTFYPRKKWRIGLLVTNPKLRVVPQDSH